MSKGGIDAKESLNWLLSDSFLVNKSVKVGFSITVLIIASILRGVNRVKLPFFPENMKESGKNFLIFKEKTDVLEDSLCKWDVKVSHNSQLSE